MRPAMAEYDGWVLTDVLLFTHLMHLPRAYASKPDNKKLPWIVYIPCRFEDNTQGVIISNITPCVCSLKEIIFAFYQQ